MSPCGGVPWAPHLRRWPLTTSATSTATCAVQTKAWLSTCRDAYKNTAIADGRMLLSSTN